MSLPEPRVLYTTYQDGVKLSWSHPGINVYSALPVQVAIVALASDTYALLVCKENSDTQPRVDPAVDHLFSHVLRDDVMSSFEEMARTIDVFLYDVHRQVWHTRYHLAFTYPQDWYRISGLLIQGKLRDDVRASLLLDTLERARTLAFRALVVEEPTVEALVVEVVNSVEEPSVVEEPSIVEEPSVLVEPSVEAELVEVVNSVEEPSVVEEPSIVEEPSVVVEPSVEAELVEVVKSVEEPSIVVEPSVEAELEEPSVEAEIVEVVKSIEEVVKDLSESVFDE
ncbi:hypothetical protein L226DRAFT_576943 [Lentinus tigrinus ALCF2SS1-7]|uniref:uncharacterized protein n=1 Tax=Lentinus tigrinus ALCF2SS1-7 TaxID=1328758 RepID=UPI001165D214|nr:hypothetical protein L226DRAFT_576943 [Lentinus tigrinus ALCF2SS1-7]